MNGHICQYGNCDSFDTPIIVTDKKRGERNRFCCTLHAVLHMLRYDRKVSLADYDAVQAQLREDFP